MLYKITFNTNLEIVIDLTMNGIDSTYYRNLIVIFLSVSTHNNNNISISSSSNMCKYTLTLSCQIPCYIIKRFTAF